MLEIDFEGHVVEWERDDQGMLDLSDAIAAHKSLGSRRPAPPAVTNTAWPSGCAKSRERVRLARGPRGHPTSSAVRSARD